MKATKEPRRAKDFSGELAEKGWYHSFQLPDGSFIEGYNTLELLKERYALYPIPAELAGKRLLDIGAWDGWFSFEAERHGADVTAVDCVEIPNFLRIHKALSSRVSYRIFDFYELPQAGLGKFDFVFFLGVLYHLKHPLLALEIVCALTADTAIVESFVTDAETWQEHRDEIPTMEFYETDEMGNQLDNWIGPTVGCLMAMCRAAGFARVEFLYASGIRAGAACYRTWEPVPAVTEREPPELLAVVHARNFGLNFSTRKEEYITSWFRTSAEFASREQLRFEVGGFGVRALYVSDEGDGTWLANFRVPPGLDAGWQPVRLRFADTGFGQTLRIAVDMPLKVERLVLEGACDSATWNEKEITVRERGFISLWVNGLPENADRANICVRLGDARLVIEFVGDPNSAGRRQINAVVPRGHPGGSQALRVESGGANSESWPLTIINGDAAISRVAENSGIVKPLHMA
jgi:tRNA (mo5U34)-methyltransferase